MNKQKNGGIDWCDATWNPATGCKNNCFYCYARKIGMRFQGHFNPTFHEDRLKQPYKQKEPSRIFVCSMSDLFGNWIPSEWIEKVIQVAYDNPHHTFQFLTQNPVRYYDFTFPPNCWLGATTVNANTAGTFTDNLLFSIGDNMTFISAEPLLGGIAKYIDYEAINWLIIGAMTGAGSEKYKPKLEWIKEIVGQARKYKIPVFMKNSLKGIWTGDLLKEFPKEGM